MPPKSSSKKAAVLWYNCEKCSAVITAQDQESHEKHCPINPSEAFRLSFVHSKCLFTTHLQPKPESEETKVIPASQLSNLIFISEPAMQLCNFVVSERVVISCPERPELAPLVRLVWPAASQFLTTVFVSNEDHKNAWEKFKGLQLRIEKIPTKVYPAKEVVLSLEKVEDILTDPQTCRDFTHIVKSQLIGKIFCEGNFLTCDFYNKSIGVIFKNFVSSVISEKSLEEELEKLSLHDSKRKQFYVISMETEVNVQLDVVVKDPIGDAGISKSDIGGLQNVLETLEEAMDFALGFRKMSMGIKISRGILLFGPTGCGKTMICEALANNTKAEVVWINTNEIFSKFLGETEKNLQKSFETAFKNYPKPTLIIVEDLDNICPRNENNEMVKRASSNFLNLLDSFSHKKDASRIFVIGTVGNIENLNPAARRCGRFDAEIEVGAPNPSSRKDILLKYLFKITHSLSEEEISDVAHVTHGYVGSDLSNLVYKAGVNSVKNGRDAIDIADMNFALSQVKPSAMREVLIENPKVKWEDIGGQEELKLKLRQAIEWPLLYSEKFEKLGIRPPRGILMFGPPGCSKTMIAKALATESRVNFLSIKGPELFSMWVGESERAVREVFRKARQVAPSIIFFDEIDAISGERSSDSGSSVKERVLAQMLTEMDGVNTLNNVLIIAATNRPDMIDKALLRPGRIDRVVYVGLPDLSTRLSIFNIKLRNVPLAHEVNINDLATRTEGYSGAEIQAICSEAAIKALEENFESELVEQKHFEAAMKIIRPRTSSDLLEIYKEYMKKDKL